MLRTIFVLAIASVGAYFAIQGAFPALLLYLWIAYFRPQEWVWTDFVRMLNLSLISGVYLVGISVVSGARFQINGRVILLAMFLVQSTLSTIFSEHSAYASIYWQDFAKSVVITYLIVVLVTDRYRFRLALLVVACSLSFEPAKQAWVQFFVAPGAKNYNEIAFLGDESGVGVGMLMLAPLLLALARTTRRSSEKWSLRFLLVGILYRAISTYSRGAFLGLGALAIMYFLRSRHKLRAAAAAALVGALVLPVLPDYFWDRMSTIETTEEEMDWSSRGRLHFWAVAVEMANANPILGIGHHAYPKAYDRYDFTASEFGTERSVHSTWFGVLAELGYPGLLLFIMLLLSAFAACRRVRLLARQAPELEDLREYAAAFEIALVAFAVSGSFIIFQYTEMLWHYFGFTTALLAVATAELSALQPAATPAEVPSRLGAPPLSPRPLVTGRARIPAARLAPER